MRKKRSVIEAIKQKQAFFGHRLSLLQKDIIAKQDAYKQQQLIDLENAKKAFVEKLKHDYDPKTLPSMWKHPIEWFTKRKLISSITTRLLINMERVNGEHETFFINLDINKFFWLEHTYIVDINARYYSIQGKCFCLDYHEQYTLPIKRQIPIKQIRGQLADKYPDISFASDPNLLKLFIESDVIKKILQGSAIEDMFNLFKILLIINLALCAITLLVVFFK